MHFSYRNQLITKLCATGCLLFGAGPAGGLAQGWLPPVEPGNDKGFLPDFAPAKAVWASGKPVRIGDNPLSPLPPEFAKIFRP